MFRGKTKSEMNPKVFGAGSFVMINEHVGFMVVSAGANSVRLLDMRTFEVMTPIVSVEDPNFLSEDETRKLISGTNCAFSDFDYEPAGLKGFSPSRGKTK